MIKEASFVQAHKVFLALNAKSLAFLRNFRETALSKFVSVKRFASEASKHPLMSGFFFSQSLIVTVNRFTSEAKASNRHSAIVSVSKKVGLWPNPGHG